MTKIILSILFLFVAFTGFSQILLESDTLVSIVNQGDTLITAVYMKFDGCDYESEDFAKETSISPDTTIHKSEVDIKKLNRYESIEIAGQFFTALQLYLRWNAQQVINEKKIVGLHLFKYK